MSISSHKALLALATTIGLVLASHVPASGQDVPATGITFKVRGPAERLEMSVNASKVVKSLIEQQDVAIVRLRRADPIVQRDLCSPIRTFCRVMAASVIDQDPPHHLRGDTEKLRAVLPGDLVLTDQPDVRLVDQRGRLECVVATLVPQVGSGSPAKLAIYERQQVFARSRVSLTPRSEQIAHAAGRGRHSHFFSRAIQFNTTVIG